MSVAQCICKRTEANFIWCMDINLDISDILMTTAMDTEYEHDYRKGKKARIRLSRKAHKYVGFIKRKKRPNKMSRSVCSYFLCDRSLKTSGIRTFTFPVKDQHRCQEWIVNSGNTDLINLSPIKLKKRFICQKHFRKEDFLSKKLTSFAVPIKYNKDSPENTYAKRNTENGNSIPSTSAGSGGVTDKMANMTEKICRLCLQTIISKNYETIGESLLKTLKLNLNISKQNVMCTKCANYLQVLSNFKAASIYMGTNANLDAVKIETTNDLNSSNETEIKCSFCTKTSRKEGFILLNESKKYELLLNMLKQHILEMNQNSTSLLTCETCLDALQDVLNFILNCLKVEEKIIKFAEIQQLDVKSQVELKDVQQFVFGSTLKFDEAEDRCDQIKKDAIPAEVEIKYEEEINHPELIIKTEEVDIKAEQSNSDRYCLIVMDILKRYENFSRLSFEDKIKIKQKGRPLPDMTIEFQGSSRGKNYTRRFNRDIYSRNKWICGCNINNSFFCFPCILFGGEIKWTLLGIRDLVHLPGRIKTHENSKRHILNQMHLALLGTTNIQAQLDSAYWTNLQKHNEEVTKNRYVLSKIIDCVKFCGAFELALRGHDETENSDSLEIFSGLINFSAELDITLHEQLQKTSMFKGTSKDIQNDLLSCILDIYYEEIAKEISAAPFIALMADETTDVSAKFQLVVVLRYTKEGVPTERFWGFLLPSGHTAEILTENILTVIKPLIGFNKDKLIAQSYDGANVLSRRIGGVQTKIKEKFPNAHFIHCYAHQLNLIMGQASSENTQVRTFFCNIQDIPAFFSNSPQRIAILDKVVGQKLPTSVPTRWNFKSRTINVVFEHRESLIECMEEIQDSLLQNNITVNKAMAIKRMLEDKTFIFWLTFFHHVMPHVDILYNQLQKRKIDAIEVNTAVKSFEENIDNIRKNKIDLIVQEVKNTSDVVKTVKRKRNQDSYENSKVAALEVCDLITTVAKDRFEFCGHLIAVSLFVPEKFQDYVVSFPVNELDSTVNAYPMLMKQRLRTELSIIYSRHEYRCLKGAVTFLKFLITNNLEDVFPEVKKLLDILVTIPMTTSETERCFSTLKRIKTFLRNTMTQESLTALAVLSIEHAFITAIPNFNERVIDKFASKKNRRMDFIYKSR